MRYRVFLKPKIVRPSATVRLPYDSARSRTSFSFMMRTSSNESKPSSRRRTRVASWSNPIQVRIVSIIGGAGGSGSSTASATGSISIIRFIYVFLMVAEKEKGEYIVFIVPWSLRLRSSCGRVINPSVLLFFRSENDGNRSIPCQRLIAYHVIRQWDSHPIFWRLF